MRILSAITLTLLLMIGTYYYTLFADSVRREPLQFDVAMDDQANWRVEIERTFDCIADPDFAADSLVVQLKGVDLYRRSDNIPGVEPIAIEQIKNIEQGSNELYIEANLVAMDDVEFASSERNNAMQVRISRGQTVVAEKTLWIAGGTSTLSETVCFEAPRSVEVAADPDHEHIP